MKLSTFLFLILFFLQCASLKAQTIITGTPAKYDVVVSFASMCCGTASDDFLKEFIKKFNTKNKDTASGWLLGGCGREGEYKILFSLTTLKESKKVKVIEKLRKLIDEQNKKNKAVNASSGSISLGYNLPLSQFEYCRGQLTKWNYQK